MDSLFIARAEPVRGNCRVAVAISRDKSTVQMRHQAHLITERCEPRINWNPAGVGFRKIMRKADIKRRTALCDYSHPERARLAGEPRAVVVGPERRWREVGMQLSRYFPLCECVLVGSA